METVAVTASSTPWAAVTVTSAPTGRWCSMYAPQAVTTSSGAGPKSCPAKITFTVPGPFHLAMTREAPTPSTLSAHC